MGVDTTAGAGGGGAAGGGAAPWPFGILASSRFCSRSPSRSMSASLLASARAATSSSPLGPVGRGALRVTDAVATGPELAATVARLLASDALSSAICLSNAAVFAACQRQRGWGLDPAVEHGKPIDRQYERARSLQIRSTTLQPMLQGTYRRAAPFGCRAEEDVGKEGANHHRYHHFGLKFLHPDHHSGISAARALFGKAVKVLRGCRSDAVSRSFVVP